MGHMFQGRFKAILVDPDAYLLVCRYVELNPVHAGPAAARSAAPAAGRAADAARLPARAQAPRQSLALGLQAIRHGLRPNWGLSVSRVSA
jgi:hypothetical protein